MVKVLEVTLWFRKMVSSNVYSVYRKWGKTYGAKHELTMKPVNVFDEAGLVSGKHQCLPGWIMGSWTHYCTTTYACNELAELPTRMSGRKNNTGWNGDIDEMASMEMITLMSSNWTKRNSRLLIFFRNKKKCARGHDVAHNVYDKICCSSGGDCTKSNTPSLS